MATQTMEPVVKDFTIDGGSFRGTDQQYQDFLTTHPQAQVPQTFDASQIGGAKASIPELPQAQSTDSFVQNLFNQYNAPVQEVQKTQDSLTSQLTTASTALEGKGAAQLAKEAELGIPQDTAKLKDLNTLIASKSAEYQNRIAALPGQGRGLTTGLVGLQTDREKRMAAVELGGLASVAQALQGNIALSQDMAQRAVDMQFAPYEQQIKNTLTLLELNKDKLTTAQKNRADQIAISLQERQRQLDEAKQNKADILKTAQDAALAGADNLTISKILKSTSSQDAFNLAAPFIQQRATQKFNADLSKINAEVQKINNENKQTGIPQITNPEANKYSGALSIILGSDKFTKDQKASLINAINSGEDPFTVIKNQAKNIAGQTEATKITNYEVAAAQLDDISSLLKQFYANGGKTNIFSGNYEKAINKLGQVSDPKLVSLATQISSALQIYRNAISGTAYSVQEGQDIAAIFPGINKSQGLNEAILAGRKAAFQSTIDGSYRSVLGNTYDTLKKAQNLPTVSDNSYGAKIQEALNAGHSPKDIIDQLKKDYNVSVQIYEAQQAGYSDDEILQYLGKSKPLSMGVNGSALADAIGQHESGGNYNARGKDGEVGKYQIMPNNYVAWAREVGVNPNDRSPQAQDAIAQYKINQYLQQYNNDPVAVAIAWNAGPGRANDYIRTGKIPQLSGISAGGGAYNVQNYVKSILNNLG